MRSALHPQEQGLILPLFLSIFAHGGALVAFTVGTLLLSFCGERKRVIDPNDTMEVAMVVLPRSARAMPDKATRAPKPVGSDAPQPVPVPDVKHTSDLAVKVDKPKTNEGVDTKKLDDAMKALEREQALLNMEAALGQLDQNATDPNSDSDEAINSGAINTSGDPAYARYIAEVRKAFMGQFHPLQSIRDANPGIHCIIHVQVEPDTGRIVRHDVTKPSGVEAFDAAARRAVEALTNVPLPPEKFRDRLAQGYDIEFK